MQNILQELLRNRRLFHHLGEIHWNMNLFFQVSTSRIYLNLMMPEDMKLHVSAFQDSAVLLNFVVAKEDT